MRTCPNCGKDTRAETTQPCTRCGFSPAAPPEIGTTNYGGETTTERRRGGAGAGTVVLLLIVLGAFGFDRIGGLLDGDLGDVFESDPGPTDTEAENALVDFAEGQVGLLGAVAVCPADAESTEVGASFDCTVTMPSGASRSVRVTNREDEIEWDGRPFLELRREEAVP